MNISFPKTVIELSPEEAIDLYYDVKRGLQHTIDTHWVNHPDSYELNEHRRLHILTQLHRAVGHDIDPLKQLCDQLNEAVKKKKGTP